MKTELLQGQVVGAEALGKVGNVGGQLLHGRPVQWIHAGAGRGQVTGVH